MWSMYKDRTRGPRFMRKKLTGFLQTENHLRHSQCLWVKMDMEKQEFDKYDPVESMMTTETKVGE
jgi:hypothetical protein